MNPCSVLNVPEPLLSGMVLYEFLHVPVLIHLRHSDFGEEVDNEIGVFRPRAVREPHNDNVAYAAVRREAGPCTVVRKSEHTHSGLSSPVHHLSGRSKCWRKTHMISIFVLAVAGNSYVSIILSAHISTISFIYSTSISSPLCLGIGPFCFSSDTLMIMMGLLTGLALELDDSESISLRYFRGTFSRCV